MITDTFDNLSQAIINPHIREDAPEVDACIVTFSHEIEKHVAEKLLRKMTALLNHDDGKTKILEIWKAATKGKADKTPTDKELTDAVAANKPQRNPTRVKNASDILNSPNSGDKEIIDILRSVSSGKVHLSADELETLKERLSDICDNAVSTEE